MIKIYNKNTTILNTEGKYCPTNIEVAVDPTNIEPENIVKGKVILGVTGTAEAGGGGGITPEGTITITENGTHDVTEYAAAEVNVPNVIPEGYIIPEGDFAISANGNYDITSYATVNVNVASEGGNTYWDDLMTARDGNWSYLFATASPADVTPLIQGYNVEQVRYMFFDNRSITSVPLFTFTGTNMDNMFYCCSNITSLPDFDTSRVISMSRVCQDNYNLATFPNWDTSKAEYMDYAFYGCSLLKEAVINTDSASKIGSIFYNCYELKKVEFSSLDKITSKYNISEICTNCYPLTQVIIRNMTKIPMIYASGSTYGAPFKSCYHIEGTFNSYHNPEGLQDGGIYVPDEWVDQLKTATTWSYYGDIIYPLSELPESYEITDRPYVTDIKLPATSYYNFSMTDGYYVPSSYQHFAQFNIVVPETATTNSITYEVEIINPSNINSIQFGALDVQVTAFDESGDNISFIASPTETTTYRVTYDNLTAGSHFYRIGVNNKTAITNVRFRRIYE